MADTGKRLAGPQLLSDSSTVVYTVPASTTTIVKHLTVVNTTGSAATFTFGIGADSTASRLYSTALLSAATTWEVGTWHVLASGETLRAHSGTTSALALTVSGVEVT